MKTLGLQNGDLYLNKGEIAIVSDSDEIAQTLDTRLKTITGEFFLDTNYGIPYWDTIQNANNISVLNVAMKNTILGTTGVVSILDFTSNLDTQSRTYTISYTVTTKQNSKLSNKKIYKF